MGHNLAERAENARDDVAKKPQTLSQQIQRMQPQYQLAMPHGAEAGQLIRDALTCLRTTKKLDQCEADSVLGGLMTLAQLGLRPGVGALGHAWLIPFWDKNAGPKNAKGFGTGAHRAQLVIGYQGYAELAYRSGRVLNIAPRTVYKNDRFKLSYGLAGDELAHEPFLDGPRGEARLYYAVARLSGGGYALTDPMTQADMETHRDRFAMAKVKEKVGGKETGRMVVVGPWQDHFEAMAHKGLALDTPIPVPSGWSTMGDLKVGDQVFDLHGKRVTVTAVSEIKNIDCYRLTFANGATIVCDGEHYWLANTGNNAARKTAEKGWGVHQIADLYAAKQAGETVKMPVVGILDSEPADLLIDPWMLGYWLGNGAKDNAHVTCHADHVEDVTAAIAATKYTVGTVRPDPRSQAVGIGVRGLSKELAELGLIGHKHIPPRYMRGSVAQRHALLSGLLDSDGHLCAERGRVRFSTVDKALTDAVAELARSLGEVVHVNEHDATGYGKTVRVYEAAWQPSTCPVTIGAKVARYRPRKFAPYRSVKSIERIPSVPTRCIEVDSETRTYAAGVEMVPTHNTMVRRLAKLLPKSTELAYAIAVDEGVRLNLAPDADPAEVTEHPEPPVIDGQVERGAIEPGADQPDTDDVEWPAVVRPGTGA